LSTRPSSRARRLPAPTAARTPAEDLGILLTSALGAFKDRLHAHLAAAGYTDLGPSFGFVFRSLADEPMSLAQLASRLGITSQGTLKIVDEMERRGYVQRKEDEADQRVRRVALTGRGRSALREARRFHAEVERELTKSLGPRRVADARAVLEVLSGDEAGTRRWLRPVW